jgi:dipeptidyl aminopeptidase/acylaminoacyl peptidase
VRTFRSTAISPDGRRLAYVERIRARDGSEELSAVDMVEVGSAPSAGRRFTAADDARAHRERDAAWSPDGRWLAYLSDARKERQLQVWVQPAAGGPARKVTNVAGQLSHPRWSPDGRSIAFLFISGSTQEPGALVPYRPDAGVVEEKIEEQRIAVVDLGSGRVREVSPANLYVYDYDWAPDGKSFAAEAAEGSGTNNYWIAQLYVVRADTGRTRSIWKPPLQIACPRYSPDGKTIAVIHGIMSDEGSTGGDIWLVPVDGGPARDMTPEIEASPSALFWRTSGELLFTEHLDGGSAVASLDPATGTITKQWSGPEALSAFSIARRSPAIAAVRQSFRRPPEVWAGVVDAWKPVTRENGKASSYWGEGPAYRRLMDKTDEELIGLLASPNVYDREIAQRLLTERLNAGQAQANPLRARLKQLVLSDAPRSLVRRSAFKARAILRGCRSAIPNSLPSRSVPRWRSPLRAACAA